MSRRGLVFWVGLLVAVIVVGFVTSGRRNETGRPLDPDSTDALGTRALVELLESFGADVVDGRSLPDDDTPTALLLADQLTPDQRDELDRWIGGGGNLVVTDPSSDYSAPVGLPPITVDERRAAGSCTEDELAGLDLEGGTFLLYDASEADGRCFADDDGAYLHLERRGRGRVVSLGGGVPLSNQYLDEADNAVLAAELLLVGVDDGDGGDPSGARITIIYDPILSAGERSLLDLVPTSVRWAGIQLVVAFGVFVLWRARRFGRPVLEPQAVKLPGSLLVRAAGELHRRSGGHAAADTTLRARHLTLLRKRLRLAPDLPLDNLIVEVADRTGLSPETVARSVAAPAADDRRELVELVAAIDAVQDAVDRSADDALGPAAIATPDPEVDPSTHPGSGPDDQTRSSDPGGVLT